MNIRSAQPLPMLRDVSAAASGRDPGEAAIDRELVERSLAGDPVAQQLLYRRHVRAVTARVTRLLARSGEAEDVVQDAFAEAFVHLSRLQDRPRFGAWLMRIAVYQVHRRFRRRRLLGRLGLDRGSDDARLENIADGRLDPEQRQELRHLDAALARLPVAERLVWMLRHVEGCELSEVAEQCDRSLSTIKRLLQRADVSLRELLVADRTHRGVRHGR